MHIPDGFLDPKVTTSLLGAAAVVLAFCLAKVREAITVLKPATVLAGAGKIAGNLAGSFRRVLSFEGENTLHKMGMVAALIFAGQMFNFPISNGTSGHLIGGVLAAVLLGPFAGALVIAVVLSVQMLFFADGGLLAIGANIINMSFFGTMVAYYAYYYLKKVMPEWLAIMAAAWGSVLLAAMACALELALSGTTTLSMVFMAMIKVHAIIGLAEALITLSLIKLFRTTFKEAI